MSRPVFLALLFASLSAFAQSEHLLMQNGPRIEAAATGSTSMLAVFTKLVPAPPCACGEITALRVGFDGNPIGTPFRVAQSFSLQTQPAVAFDGQNFLVVWNELADPPLASSRRPSRVVGAFVPENGAPLHPFVIADASVVRPVVVWEGTRYFVFYSDLAMHASGTMVSDVLGVRGLFRVADLEQVTSAAVAPSEVAAIGLRADKVELVKVDSAFNVSPPRILDAGAGDARVAWNGKTFLAIWNAADGIAGRSDENIYERHLIAADPFGSGLQLVAVGPVFLAAWDDGAVATSWISTDRFSALSSIGGFPQLTKARRYPLLVNVPGRGVAMFYQRVSFSNQFVTVLDDYVMYVTPPRQRVTRR